MRRHNETTSWIVRFLRPIGLGSVIGTVACFVLLLLMAAVVASGTISASGVTWLSMIAATFGALVAGFASARLSREKGLLYGAASGLLLLVLTTAIGWMVVPDAVGSLLWVRALLMLGGGALGGILGVNLKRRR